MLKYLLSEFSSNRHYASVIDDRAQLLTEHTHDYYELTLVQSGSCIHHVNNQCVPLHIASLSLIRPSDTHYYEPKTASFQLINVIIPQPTIVSMFEYLGTGFEAGRLLDIPLPPVINISMQNFRTVCDSLRNLILYKTLLGTRADAFFHMTLMNIITTSFPITLVHTHTQAPIWLQWLVLEMSKKENYIEGISAMTRLADKTQEHICRSCRKHLGMSPTQIINDMRLRQAARMLVETDDSIIDISIEAGFNNLSHFYHVFQSTYQMSPKHFRQLSDASLIHQHSVADTMFVSLPKGESVRNA
ncbi:MAG: AraC family transcriptional regulator [Clostridia bacterium]